MTSMQRIAAAVVGAVLAVVGIAGYFAGDQFAGIGANALHDTIHLVTGLIAAVAFTGEWTRSYNKALGVFYLVVGLLGLIAFGFFENLLAANTAAHVFHLVVGAVAAAVGFALPETSDRKATT